MGIDLTAIGLRAREPLSAVGMVAIALTREEDIAVDFGLTGAGVGELPLSLTTTSRPLRNATQLPKRVKPWAADSTLRRRSATLAAGGCATAQTRLALNAITRAEGRPHQCPESFPMTAEGVGALAELLPDLVREADEWFADDSWRFRSEWWRENAIPIIGTQRERSAGGRAMTGRELYYRARSRWAPSGSSTSTSCAARACGCGWSTRFAQRRATCSERTGSAA